MSKQKPLVLAVGAAVSALARIKEIVNLLPNVFVDQTSQVANGTTDISSLDLRGLDAERTLVLLGV